MNQAHYLFYRCFNIIEYHLISIIEYLTKQLLSPNSKKSQMKNDKCNLNETFNGDKSFYDNEFSDESNMDKNKKIE